jgi:hypothetical protein
VSPSAAPPPLGVLRVRPAAAPAGPRQREPVQLSNPLPPPWRGPCLPLTPRYTPMEFRAFPFDSQNLVIQLEATQVGLGD